VKLGEDDGDESLGDDRKLDILVFFVFIYGTRKIGILMTTLSSLEGGIIFMWKSEKKGEKKYQKRRKMNRFKWIGINDKDFRVFRCYFLYCESEMVYFVSNAIPFFRCTQVGILYLSLIPFLSFEIDPKSKAEQTGSTPTAVNELNHG